jgi:cell division protein FtsB
MGFLEIINEKKFTLISILLFLYVILNLLDGERGLISYYKKQQEIENLIGKKESLISELNLIEKKNSLLTDVVDLDYLEILYREKFMVGKSNEKIYNYKY